MSGTLKPDETFSVERTIPQDHPCIAGHFPNAPIVPAALINACVHEELQLHFNGGDIVGASKLKFIAPILPAIAFHIKILPIKNASIPVSITQSGNICFSGLFHFA